VVRAAPVPEAHWRDVTLRPVVAGYYVTEPDWGPQDWCLLYQSRPQHQLWLTEAGAGWLDVAGRRYPLRPGGVLLVPPGSPRFGGRDPGDQGASLRLYVVLLEVRVGGDAAPGGLAWLPPGLRLPPLVWAQAAAAADELIAELAGRRPGHAALAAAAATRLLGICWREAAEQGVLDAPPPAPAPGNAGPTRLRPVLEHIAGHYHQPLTLRELAAVAHFSPSHLCTAFRRELGLPPLEYVRRYRLARAKDLLLEGRLGVAEVAGAVGFPDASHFSRVFRRCEGVTPAAYRAQRRPIVA
jgi:AraC family transcriptional regulator